jgi:nucleoside-diphosphate-sugar epimerase
MDARKPRVLVTGASGFVGRHLCEALLSKNISVIGITRQPDPDLSAAGVIVRVAGDLAETSTLVQWLNGCDAIAHLAGRAHVMRDSSPASSALYFKGNLDSTKAIAKAGVAAGVRRFLFLSTIKVFGNNSSVRPLRPHDLPSPSDAYGQSKLDAESWLLNLSETTSLDTIIVRPPLIYGPRVRANFLQLMQLVRVGIPLPFGKAANLRSYVSIWNLSDLVTLLLNRNAPGKGIWHVSDADDCSTGQLIQELALLMGKPNPLFNVPLPLVAASMALIGRKAQYDRLVGASQLDVSETLTKLAWRPPQSRMEGLSRTVSWFLDSTQATRP